MKVGKSQQKGMEEGGFRQRKTEGRDWGDSWEAERARWWGKGVGWKGWAQLTVPKDLQRWDKGWDLEGSDSGKPLHTCPLLTCADLRLEPILQPGDQRGQDVHAQKNHLQRETRERR